MVQSKAAQSNLTNFNFSFIFSLIMPSGDFGGNTEIEYHAGAFPTYNSSEIYSPEFNSSFERQEQSEAVPQRQLTESEIKPFRYV